MTNIEYVDLDSNYALVHDTMTRKHQCFQNAQMDEQFIIVALGDADTLEEYALEGTDDLYGENSIFFVPNNQIDAAKDRMQEFLNQWKSDGEGIRSFDEGVIYIAYKYTPSGMWIFTSDNTYENAFYEESFNIFDDGFQLKGTENEVCDTNTFWVTGTPAESGGVDFYNSLLREGDPITSLMQSEGIVFEGVQVY